MALVLNPGAIGVVSARFLQPWRGVWMADLVLDPVDVALAPTAGKVTITIGAPPGTVQVVTGTIDPRGSGQFAGMYSLRVVGGGGGWDKVTTPMPFHSDGQLLTPAVYVPTGAAVGEVVSVLVPTPLGIDFVRLGIGPASRVFDREPSWWVDPLTGTTFVGPRPPAIPDPSLTLLFSEQLLDTVELTCDVLVAPGTPIVDPRLGAIPVIIRDVEQTFSKDGSRVTAWCSDSAVSQLTNEFRSMVQEFSGRRFLQSYLYRIVGQNPADGRLTLQAVHPSEGAPDAVAISAWGQAGDTAKYTPSTVVRLSFIEGDETQPIVDAFQPGTLPIERDIDATGVVNIGATAPLTALGGGAAPVALSPPILTLNAALGVWAAAVAAALSSAGFPIAGPTGTLAAAITTAAGGTPAKKVTAT